MSKRDNNLNKSNNNDFKQTLKETNLNENPIIAEGTVLDDRYLIKDMLKTDVISQVYTARDQNKARDVAIKMIREEFLSNPRKRLLIESSTDRLKKIFHTHIVSIYASFEEKGNVFIVFEFLKGINLDQNIEIMKKVKQRFSVEEVVRVGNALCSAVEYACSCMIPLELSLQKIVLCTNGDIKLRGLTKEILFNSLVSNNKSNEQIVNDEKQGQYIIAKILYIMMTGQKFKKSDQNLFKNNLNIPNKFLRTIERALAKDSADQYSSITKFRKALLKKGKHNLFLKTLIILFVLLIGAVSFLTYNNLNEKIKTKLDNEKNKVVNNETIQKMLYNVNSEGSRDSKSNEIINENNTVNLMLKNIASDARERAQNIKEEWKNKWEYKINESPNFVDEAQIELNKGDELYNEKNYEQALNSFNNAIDKFKQSKKIVLQYAKEREAAVKIRDLANIEKNKLIENNLEGNKVKSEKIDKGIILLNEGNVFYNSNQYEEAKNKFISALKVFKEKSKNSQINHNDVIKQKKIALDAQNTWKLIFSNEEIGLSEPYSIVKARELLEEGEIYLNNHKYNQSFQKYTEADNKYRYEIAKLDLKHQNDIQQVWESANKSVLNVKNLKSDFDKQIKDSEGLDVKDNLFNNDIINLNLEMEKTEIIYKNKQYSKARVQYKIIMATANNLYQQIKEGINCIKNRDRCLKDKERFNILLKAQPILLNNLKIKYALSKEFIEEGDGLFLSQNITEAFNKYKRSSSLSNNLFGLASDMIVAMHKTGEENINIKNAINTLIKEYPEDNQVLELANKIGIEIIESKKE